MNLEPFIHAPIMEPKSLENPLVHQTSQKKSAEVGHSARILFRYFTHVVVGPERKINGVVYDKTTRYRQLGSPALVMVFCACQGGAKLKLQLATAGATKKRGHSSPEA